MIYVMIYITMIYPYLSNTVTTIIHVSQIYCLRMMHCWPVGPLDDQAREEEVARRAEEEKAVEGSGPFLGGASLRFPVWVDWMGDVNPLIIDINIGKLWNIYVYQQRFFSKIGNVCGSESWTFIPLSFCAGKIIELLLLEELPEGNWFY